MIFLDECGVDIGNVLNSKFFVISVADILDFEKENLKIRKALNHKTDRLKWQKLDKKERLLFIKYSKSVNYKVEAIFKTKSVDDTGDYLKVMKVFCDNKFFNKKVITYHGLHLNGIFQKVKSYLKYKNIILNFKEAKGADILGIQIADLWAGYINYAMKNNLEIPASDNITIREYIDPKASK